MKRSHLVVGCGEWGFREMPMEDHFRITADFGMKYMEFGIGGGQPGRLPESPTDNDIANFLALSKQYEIQTPFCCLENDFTLADESEHRSVLDRVLGQLRTAAACQATHVRLFASFTPIADMTAECWSRMIDAFVECNQVCQELGMQIAIETHGALTFQEDGSAQHTSTASTHGLGLGRLLKALPPEVGFNFDPGNIKAAEPDCDDLHLELLNRRINYCHLKDWRRTEHGWLACAVGDDDLDYQPLLQDMQFDGVFLIEYEPLEDSVAGIERSLKYLQTIVDDVRFK